MQQQKPKSVRTIGLIVSIFSGFIIFSNGMGALASSWVGLAENQSEEKVISEFDLSEFILDHYVSMCLIMVAIGILYLIGGLSIRKYKMWANKLVTYLSALLIVLIWTLMIIMSSMTAGHQELVFFSTGAIITAVFFSAPIGLLIWFLNREKIKKHFT